MIEVTNTLAKAHHENSYDRYGVQEPTGLLGPVEILWKEYRKKEDETKEKVSSSLLYVLLFCHHRTYENAAGF